MKMFSDCSGECCICAHGGFCLAGHGDDDYFPASKEKIIDNLDNHEYPDYTNYMIDYLRKEHGYVYDANNLGIKKRKKKREEREQKTFSFGGYTFTVVVAGKCVACGRNIRGGNIFLCEDCERRNKGNAERAESYSK